MERREGEGMKAKEVAIAFVGLIVSAAVVLGGLALAVGFKTPNQVQEQNKNDFDNLKDKVYGHETRISVVESQISDIKGGIEELVGHPLRHKR